ncbi:flagellar filament capping protein FliD [Caballeronia sp. AZ7_KS35]|uniref:flagellar filament capping protein FliD n=1 Tax=Caballeronia sp. AZ7_KS35 TaxID=2921762 RepID=UPI00202878CC|nr:flagellar filament capping protein FliD [Caballeronia sp. AZ7_KS35]
MTTVATTTGSAVDPTSAVQQAAQSIISGSTNSTMDVNSLVNALVSSKVAGQTDALNNKQTADNTQLTAIGTLKSVLSLLQSSLTNLSNGTALGAFTAAADGKGITATADTTAVAGSYSVSVANIAKSQSLTSGVIAAGALGTGSLTLNVNGKSSTVKIDSSNNTLSGIASAINSASDNPGVTATVINGADGQHLVLRSSSTGVSSAINMTVQSSDSGLNSLGVTSGTTTVDPSDSSKTVTPYTTLTSGSSNWTQTSSGQDAHLTIAGTAVTSGSNTVKDAISGVSMTLTSDSVASSPQELTVTQDTDNLKTAINSFVTAYNNFITTASSLTSYDSTSSSQGALLGDSMMNTIKNTISSTISKAIGSGSSAVNLASIGIALQPDGSLKTDDDALTAALSSNSGTVAKLFNTTNGVAATLNNSLTSFLQTGGIIDTRTTALNADLSSIADQQTQLTAYTAQLTTDYNAQFTALNALMSSMSTQSSYLTALFGGTNSAGALATNKS